MRATKQTPRRILLLIPILGTAGAETQLVHLAEGLARAGHRVTVAAMVGLTRDAEPLLRGGVRVIVLGATSRLRKLLALPRLVRLARGADVVHCELWDATLWGRLAAIVARRPVVVAEQGPGRALELSRAGAPRGRWISAHNRLLDRFTFAVVPCAEWQVAMLEGDGVDPRKIVHIPNAVPIEAFRASARGGATRADLGLPADAKVVVHVARLEAQKNQRVALDTVARLRHELGDVRLLLAGDGRERAGLEAHARELGGGDWALFLGNRSDVAALFGLADLAVLPSLGEGLPVSLIEAIAAGLPTVATDVGDVRRVLEQSGAGICVPAGDPDAFFEACRTVLSDDEVREDLARNASESRHFDAPAMVERHAALFESAASGRLAPPVPTRRVTHAVSAGKALSGHVRMGYNAFAGRGNLFTHQPLGRRIDPAGLGGYYCDFRHKARVAAERHPTGFPHLKNGRPIEFAVAVAQAALGYWELYLDGEDTAAEFLNIADWLVAEAAPAPSGLAWYTDFALPKYHLAPGWASALGQGEAISVLVRAHALSGDERYMETARAAAGPMGVEVADGGVLRRIDGHPVLEEYPTRRPSAVLNGWIFALIGLHELGIAADDPEARRLYAESRAGLLALLPRYDVGWWSLYSLYDHGRPDLAKPFYQRLHPVMLDALDLIEPDERLRDFARRWEGQLTRPALARNAANKIGFRIWRARHPSAGGEA